MRKDVFCVLRLQFEISLQVASTGGEYRQSKYSSRSKDRMGSEGWHEIETGRFAHDRNKYLRSLEIAYRRSDPTATWDYRVSGPRTTFA